MPQAKIWDWATFAILELPTSTTSKPNSHIQPSTRTIHHGALNVPLLCERHHNPKFRRWISSLRQILQRTPPCNWSRTCTQFEFPSSLTFTYYRKNTNGWIHTDTPTANNPYPDLKSQKAFEKGLLEKTAKQTADIILYDNRIVLYKSESDVMMYVVGGVEENEIMLYNVILALRDSLHLLFKYALSPTPQKVT